MRNENKVVEFGEIYRSERVQITKGKNKNDWRIPFTVEHLPDEQADHKPLFAPSTAIA